MIAYGPSAEPPIDLANVEADAGEEVGPARSVCDRRPALDECRQWALRNDVAVDDA